MAIRPEPPTCAELKEQEQCDQADCHETFCKQPSVDQLKEQFFPGNDRDRQLEAADLIFLQQICPDFLSNGKGTKCGCGNGDKCCSEEVRTGCDDPDECPNRNYGLDLVVVLKAALHAMSLAYIPVAGMEYPDATDPNFPVAPGQILVWDDQAVPQNKVWDKCKPKSSGAFVPTDLKTLVADCLAELGVTP